MEIKQASFPEMQYLIQLQDILLGTLTKEDVSQPRDFSQAL